MKQKVSVALLCAVVMAVSVSCSKDDTASVTESGYNILIRGLFCQF